MPAKTATPLNCGDVPAAPVATSLSSLDQLIARYDGRKGSSGRGPRSPCELLTEHLEAARRCLLGNMRLEYEMNLKQAISSLDCIPGKTDRANARMAIDVLRKEKDQRSRETQAV